MRGPAETNGLRERSSNVRYDAHVLIPAFIRYTLRDGSGFAIVNLSEVLIVEARDFGSLIFLKDGGSAEARQSPQELLDVMRGGEAPEHLTEKDTPHA